MTFLIGHNAQGKTNALEACYLALGRPSFRARRIRDLIQFDRQSCKLSARIETNNIMREIDLHLALGSRKMFLDGKPVSRSNPFPSEVKSILLTPDDLNLIRGAPRLRRHYLDTLIGHAYPQHLITLADYTKTIAQKNRYLVTNQISNEMLEIWNHKVLELGTRLVRARIRCLDHLKKNFSSVFQQIFCSDDSVDISYVSRQNYDSDDPYKIQARLNDALSKDKEKEIAKRRSLVGPHLDDIWISLNARPAGTYCSQGQARILSLTLKAVEILWVIQQCNSIPIFLLDDIFSELDDIRRSQLIEFVKGFECQTIITSTNEGIVAAMIDRDSKCYEVINGHFIVKEPL